VSTPPPSLAPQSYAARLYASMAPLASADASYGWSLLILCNAIGTMFQLIDDVVRDSEDGPGWSMLLDLDRTLDEALPWLGQFAGVRVISGSTPDQMRQRIRSTDGFRRGTAAAMRGAAQATLTGAQTVLFHERDGDPYFLSVETYADQTPDPAATEAALLAQKPGGIVLTYRTVTGQTWQQLKDSGRTWADVNTDYPSWGDVRADEPS
jgi:uncharacterized iron-regulated membrane protein